MGEVELGRLEWLDPRSVWPHEARNFTPWLLGNAERLGEALGVDLELHEAEHPVGGFSLDLIGTDLTNDTVVIVENQLEQTDHTHLGQILTYAAGTGATTIVWIGASFSDEHRQALDWLNEQTATGVHFFGVKLSLVRIGQSEPAPFFEVVAKPNDWQKRVRGRSAAASGAGPKAERYRAFWGRWLERVREEHPHWTSARAPQASNWMNSPGPLAGTTISVNFPAGDRLRNELYIDSGDAAANLALLQYLEHRRSELEEAFGRPLQFEELPNRRACRVADYGEGNVDREDEWSIYLDWFIDSGARLRSALAAVVPLTWPEPAEGNGSSFASDGLGE